MLPGARNHCAAETWALFGHLSASVVSGAWAGMLLIGWLVGLFLVEVGNLPFALVCQTMLCPCLGFAKCLEMLCPHEEETL